MASCEKINHIDEEDSTVAPVDETVTESSLEKFECAVCLQTCIQPVRLPCGHIFCYLCVKGVTHQSKRCAMCRQEIPASYLDNPSVISAQLSNIAFEGSYQWFYEGRNGWWQYDERTSLEIEATYKRGDKQCEVLIAGFLYKIDLENNVQVRRCDPSRRRKIKRDHVSISKKGVAGIRLSSDPVSPEESHITSQSLKLNESCCSQSSNSSSGSVTDFNSSCIDSSSSQQ